LNLGKTKGPGEIAHRKCNANLTKGNLLFLLLATKTVVLQKIKSSYNGDVIRA